MVDTESMIKPLGLSRRKRIFGDNSGACQNYLEYLLKETGGLVPIIIKFPYNARFDWLKQRTLSENKVQVNDTKLAFKFLLRNFDKFDPN